MRCVGVGSMMCSSVDANHLLRIQLSFNEQGNLEVAQNSRIPLFRFSVAARNHTSPRRSVNGEPYKFVSTSSIHGAGLRHVWKGAYYSAGPYLVRSPISWENDSGPALFFAGCGTGGWGRWAPYGVAAWHFLRVRRRSGSFPRHNSWGRLV